MASKLKAPQPINAARISFYTADSVSTNDIIVSFISDCDGLASVSFIDSFRLELGTASAG